MMEVRCDAAHGHASAAAQIVLDFRQHLDYLQDANYNPPHEEKHRAFS